jgi:hypothetical protein
MKTVITTIALCFLFATTANGQWLPGKSCNAMASEIADQAVAHMVNLESPFAVGMADAALMIDENCGTAKLIKANLSLGGQFGNQQEQLDMIDVDALSESEKAWHSLLSDDSGDWATARKALAEEYPNVPLFQFWAVMADDDPAEAMQEYADNFPEYASPAYNMLSYAYARGDGVEQDMDMAMEIVEKAIAAHDGPNAYDSRAEHYAAAEDYDNAFSSQLQALNYAAGPSPYQQYAMIYWRHTNKEALTDSVKSYTKQRIQATMMNDLEGLERFRPESMTMMACNSNMGPCEMVDEPMQNDAFTWNDWEVGDIVVQFNEEMTMAITAYTSTGNYTMNESGEIIDYHTRASEVWQLEGGSWVLVHSNFAPMPDGAGLPRM